jgi:hypothetical protein
MDSQFFVTLPSNSLSDIANTASNFSVRLPYRLILQGEWECALCEFIYPNTWYNLMPNDNLITFYDISTNTRHKLKIPCTRYETITDLVEAIQQSLHLLSDNEKIPYTQYIDITYRRLSRAVVLKVDLTKIKSLNFSDHLLYMLGFEREQFDKSVNPDRLKIVARHPSDLKAGLETMYVYCNIIEQQIAGDILAPLLRIVNVEGSFSDIIDKIYIAPHYVPVLIKDINTIEISIRTDRNEPVKFISGKTVVKLHFRKRRIF